MTIKLGYNPYFSSITTTTIDLSDLLEAKIKTITEGPISTHFAAKLRRLQSKQNIETICATTL